MSSSRRVKATRRIDLGGPGIPGGPAADVTDIPPEYWRAFGLLAFTMNRFIVDHIVRSARLFENDTEAMILFGMLAHLNVVHLMPPGSSPSTALDRRGRVPDPQTKSRPVRIRDLAQITGRPRETIRRKLEQMRAAGRVHHLPDGWVYDASSVDAEMQAMTVDGVRRFLKTADIMQTLLEDATVALREDAAAPAGPTRRQRKS